MNEVDLSAVASIGEKLQLLIHHHQVEVKEFETLIDDLLQLLESVDLPNTRGAADRLMEFRRDKLSHYGSASLNSQDDTSLCAIAETVRVALHHETVTKRTVFLDPSNVSDRLQRLTEAFPHLTAAQQLLREETVRTLEMGTLRSTIVMAWSFAYDYVRHWAFSEHRADFNQQLTSAYRDRNGNPIFGPVTAYEDFWEASPSPGERQVIDTCHGASFLPGKQYDALCQALRQRNDFAHPNFKTPDLDFTKGYIATLINTISDSPFPKPNVPL